MMALGLTMRVSWVFFLLVSVGLCYYLESNGSPTGADSSWSPVPHWTPRASSKTPPPPHGSRWSVYERPHYSVADHRVSGPPSVAAPHPPRHHMPRPPSMPSRGPVTHSVYPPAPVVESPRWYYEQPAPASFYPARQPAPASFYPVRQPPSYRVLANIRLNRPSSSTTPVEEHAPPDVPDLSSSSPQPSDYSHGAESLVGAEPSGYGVNLHYHHGSVSESHGTSEEQAPADVPDFSLSPERPSDYTHGSDSLVGAEQSGFAATLHYYGPGSAAELPDADGEPRELVIFSEICALKKIEGPCRAIMERFYFNIDTGRCEAFRYGGCRGNANNFETLEACAETCCLVSGYTQPTRPKTHCEHHRDRGLEPFPVVGAFVPQCDAEGQYIPLQCQGSSGHCWCVDNRGQERAGTRTTPGTRATDCDKPEPRPKTQCEHCRDSAQSSSPGAFKPRCDEEGQYRPLQCHGSTGHCWCVDDVGQERTGTRTPPGTPPTACDKPDQTVRPKSRCEHHRDSVQTASPEGYPIVGAFVPQCDEVGQYRPLQCHGSTGPCWCVDSRGQERAGPRTTPGTPPTDCHRPVEPVHKTHCEHNRDSVQSRPGAFIPQCDANGQYTAQQCHASTGYCWCVDQQGQERTGTMTSPGTQTKDCNKPVEPVHKTHCEHNRDSVQSRPGAFIPQCDANGQYTAQQCHASTGYCWCVDQQGQERTGTMTSPGTQTKDCNKPVEPVHKTHCEHNRDSVQSRPGAFIPQCDANGQYTAQQCHASTGYCWCVDQQGQERTGTMTSPGTQTKDCNKPDEPVHHKSQCEHHRDSIQTTSPEGYPILGVFVPQCHANGEYQPLQCHGSTGYCWCVDSMGQERTGTRTAPGTSPRDCGKPEHVDIPGFSE